MTISHHERAGWNVSDDGGHTRPGVRGADGAGARATVNGCCRLTLPGPIRTALRRRHGDENPCCAHPLGSWRPEQASGPFDMVTPTTPDGVSMPRSLSAEVENAPPQAPRRTDLHTPN